MYDISYACISLSLSLSLYIYIHIITPPLGKTPAPPNPPERRVWSGHATPIENHATPIENHATPIENPTTPIEIPTTPIENPTTPIENPATPRYVPQTTVPQYPLRLKIDSNRLRNPESAAPRATYFASSLLCLFQRWTKNPQYSASSIFCLFKC